MMPAIRVAKEQFWTDDANHSNGQRKSIEQVTVNGFAAK